VKATFNVVDLGTLLSCTLDIDSSQLVRKLLIIFLPFAINSISVTILQTLLHFERPKKKKNEEKTKTLSTIFQLLNNTLVTLWSDFVLYNQVNAIDF